MTPRRRLRRPYVAPPLDPATFVRRIAAKAGSDYGIALVRHPFGIVAESGDPEPSMREVQRARRRAARVSGGGEDLRFAAGREAIFGPIGDFDDDNHDAGG